MQFEAQSRMIELSTSEHIQLPIRNRLFCDFVDDLRRTEHFLLREGVAPDASYGADAAVYGKDGLDTIIRARLLNRKVRQPTAEEWASVSRKAAHLRKFIIEEHKRKLQLFLIPRMLFQLPMILGGLLLIGLLLAANGLDPSSPPWLFVVGLVCWDVSLGALGAIAYLYVNALSLQIDGAVDVTNRSFVWVRIIIGAVFGAVIGLAVAGAYFHGFVEGLKTLKTESKPPGFGEALQNSVMVLLPFLMGFSTPLVLNIVTRVIDTIQAALNISPGPIKEQSPPKPT